MGAAYLGDRAKVAAGAPMFSSPPIGTACQLTLPWPPSVNSYWRSIPLDGKVRVLISSAGRKYARRIGQECMVQRAVRFGAARIKYLAIACAPDNGVHDLGNLSKALDDALTKAGVWYDDKQIDDFRFIRGPVVPGGRLQMTIEAIG